ncbi:Fibrillin-1 [Geodia barretti]|uniref:Fibrillin-1 n=1 Tax=Geodia barretti TaxID=519541 RepID=A0AA35XM77_GEOBA|nr:Fibrillin-1 [Geodia barretti]
MTGAPEDYLSICAMCSDTDAAVRWTIRESTQFDILLLRYSCSQSNGTEQRGLIEDGCFETYPNWIESLTGTTGVGYKLSTGVQCQFSVGYRLDGHTIVKSESCTIKKTPDECNIDRVSEINEEGECEVKCAAGYAGPLCNNTNECAGSNACGHNADCVDTDGSYWCQCLPGFQGDGYNCTDINECELLIAKCRDNAKCLNIEGNYSCDCKSGFAGDGYNYCEDINECQNVTCGENAECLNTEGSYSCGCKSGFTGDGYNCTDIDECIMGEHTCIGMNRCINQQGTHYCKSNETSNAAEDSVNICAMCSDTDAAVRWTVKQTSRIDVFLIGYQCFDENGTLVHTWHDSDSCFEPYPNWGQHTGTIGVGKQLRTGLTCQFIAGYRVNSQTLSKVTNCTIKSPVVCAETPDECNIDRVSEINEEGECEVECAAGFAGPLCNNINECNNTNRCDDNADCVDSDGSYWCQCLPGFLGDGYNCTDINECKNVTCGENAECLNTEGSYSCGCKSGFTGDGYNCTDINDCHNVSCGENATCIDEVGNYSCECDSGFTGDGYNCTDINDCHNVSCGENATCINEVGNYSCACDSGFTGDGYNCTDKDECVEEAHNCTGGSYCVNTMGSYNCLTIVTSTGGRTNIVAVAVFVPVASLVLVILLVTVVLISLHRLINRREKMPAFHELTKMDLDPYYTPTFWSGSLLSIRSLYEKLIFIDSMTDVNRTEEREMEYGGSSREGKPPKFAMEKVDNPARTVTLHTEKDSHSHSTSQKNYVSHVPVGLPRQQGNGEIARNGFDNQAISTPDSLITPGKDKTSPNTTISCVNYTFDVALPDITLPSSLDNIGRVGNCTQPRNMGGYVLESISSSRSCIQHQVTSSGDNAKFGDTLDIDHSSRHLAVPEIENVVSSTSSSRAPSGIDYQAPLEAVNHSRNLQERPKDFRIPQVELQQGPNDFQSPQEVAMDFRTPQEGAIPAGPVQTSGKQRHVTDYIENSDVSSSGYSTDSAVDRRGASSFSADHAPNTITSWGSQASLQSSDTDNTTTTAELAQPDLDSVKFTINARQEFEYENAMEETFLTDVKFEILPQEN